MFCLKCSSTALLNHPPPPPPPPALYTLRFVKCKKYGKISLHSKQRTKKRKLDQLVTSETVDGGKLREAATRKDDQRILLHILGNDCVALEVKYHKRCYEHYTSFLRHANPKDAIKYKFNKSFECFSSWVKKEVIENENIFYMRKPQRSIY